MNSPSTNSSEVRSNKSGWFNLKYLLLFLNMILVYINFGLFFYLFTKDFRKSQQFNLKNYPNLRYATQISSDRINQSGENGLMNTKKVILSSGNEDEISYFKNELSTNRPYKTLNEVVSMFGQQENLFGEEDDRRQFKRPYNKEDKNLNLINMIRSRKDKLKSEVGLLNQVNNEISESSKKNKNSIKKSNYLEIYDSNRQLSLIYLVLALNNFFNFICLTKESRSNILLVLTLPPIFTVLPLIVMKFNYDINIWLFVVYIVIGFFTFLHVNLKIMKKRNVNGSEKRAPSEQISHSPARLYHNFVSLDLTATNNPTTSQHFLALNDLSKSNFLIKEKSNCNLISVEKKSSDQLPAIKRIMNFKKFSPPPSYSECYHTDSKLGEL